MMDHKEADIFIDLLLSLLAVNGWTLEKSGSILSGLEEQRLIFPEDISSSDFPDVFSRLKKAGYTKSDYVTSLLSERLIAVAKAFKTEGLREKLAAAEKRGDIAEVRSLLLPIHGIGPKVVENYLLLRRSSGGLSRMDD